MQHYTFSPLIATEGLYCIVKIHYSVNMPPTIEYNQLKKKYEEEIERLVKLYDKYQELEKKFEKEKESLVKLWYAYQIQEKEIQELRLKVSSLESEKIELNLEIAKLKKEKRRKLV